MWVTDKTINNKYSVLWAWSFSLFKDSKICFFNVFCWNTGLKHVQDDISGNISCTYLPTGRLKLTESSFKEQKSVLTVFKVLKVYRNTRIFLKHRICKTIKEEIRHSDREQMTEEAALYCTVHSDTDAKLSCSSLLI